MAPRCAVRDSAGCPAALFPHFLGELAQAGDLLVGNVFDFDQVVVAVEH